MAYEGYPTIMVVEDDLDLRDIYVQLLDHNGFYSTGFSDAQSALVAIKEKSFEPKLIVLDYMLPGMNGAQFTKALTELPGVEKIPVILVSALSGETPEIAMAKSHPWIVAFFSKADIASNRLVDFIKAYFGLE